MLSFVNVLWNSPSHEEKSLALAVLNEHKQDLTKSDMWLMEKIMRESKNKTLGTSIIYISLTPNPPCLFYKKKNINFWSVFLPTFFVSSKRFLRNGTMDDN